MGENSTTRNAWWRTEVAPGKSREDILRQLWEAGALKTQAIADVIGAGCTKNMVISKAHRLALNDKVERERPPAPPNPFEGLSGNACQWPHGNPGEEGFHFCGVPKTRGSYCDEHAARAYIISPTRKSGWSDERRDAARVLQLRRHKADALAELDK